MLLDVQTCLEKGCGLQFYRFPLDPDQRRRWVAAVDLKYWEPSEYTWICSKHFVTGTKSNNPLTPNYVSSIFKHLSSSIKQTMESNAVDYQRRQSAEKRRTEKASWQELAEDTRDKEQKAETERKKELKENEERKFLEGIEKERRTAEIKEIKMEQERRAKELEKQKAIEKKQEVEELKVADETLIECNEELLTKCLVLEEHLLEVTKDKQKVQSQLQLISQEVLNGTTLMVDDKKVKYFTGLPSFLVLKSIYNLTSKGISESADCFLFDQYLLTLVKMRLNTGDTDLACRFGISQSSVSRYIHKWVDILYTQPSFLVHWPERPNLMKKMPSNFQKHLRNVSLS